MYEEERFRVKRDHSVGARAVTRSQVYEVVARPSPSPPMKRRVCGLCADGEGVYSKVVRVSVCGHGS